MNELHQKRIDLNRKIEELCYRYLNYKSKKDQEIFVLRSNLEEAMEIIETTGFDYISDCTGHFNRMIEDFSQRKPLH